MAGTLRTLSGIIAAETGLAEVQVTPETAMADIPGWDSVNMTCVILAIEKHYGFTFTPDEMDGLKTIDDFQNVIQAKAPVCSNPKAI